MTPIVVTESGKKEGNWQRNVGKGKKVDFSKPKNQDTIEGSFCWKALKDKVERELSSRYQHGDSSTVMYAKENSKEGEHIGGQIQYTKVLTHVQILDSNWS